MRLLPSGTRGILLELDDLDEVLSWHAALRETNLPGVVDVVPAGRTILVVTERADDLAEVADHVRALTPREHQRIGGELLRIHVRYDGEDLADVADALACSVEEVVARHQDEEWTVAFCGFAPGFAYLAGANATWDLPRRATPRTKVPAGALGLAGGFTGVYPRESPGGWQLIGHSLTPVFDERRDPPALLVPGSRVRFVEER